ncbi:SANT associated [Dillenia turbinata]|uniref:SANT associated n=1 Tax=Dillenia turbinata TaxID=194707 RepID=A0AAN8UPS3_9MAGN
MYRMLDFMEGKKKTKPPSASTTPIPTTANIIPLSSFLKSVYLNDWWLIKVPDDSTSGKLGVGGFASSEQGPRAFFSAAITKRHSISLVETADGINIELHGFMNKSRSHENGFPPKVCQQFFSGFPLDWENYAAQHSVGGPTVSRSSEDTYDEHDMSSDSTANCALPYSDDLRVTTIRDLMLFAAGNFRSFLPTKGIVSDILRKLNIDDLQHHEEPSQHYTKSKYQTRLLNPVPRETPDVNREWKNHQESDTCRNDLTPVAGVVTRSQSRLKKTKNKETERDAVQSQVVDGTYDRHSLLQESSRQIETRTIGSASRVSTGSITSPKKKEMKRTRKTSAVRRSARLKSWCLGLPMPNVGRRQIFAFIAETFHFSPVVLTILSKMSHQRPTRSVSGYECPFKEGMGWVRPFRGLCHTHWGQDGTQTGLVRLGPHLGTGQAGNLVTGPSLQRIVPFRLGMGYLY